MTWFCCLLQHAAKKSCIFVPNFEQAPVWFITADLYSMDTRFITAHGVLGFKWLELVS